MIKIYCITNTKNNKKYIGQTRQDLRRRFSQHMTTTSCCAKLKEAVEEFGKESFQIELLIDGLSKSEAKEKEAEYIISYNTRYPEGYNLLSAGFSSTHSEITKKKMSKTRKGKHPHWATEASRSEESCRKRSESHKTNGSSVWTKERRENARLAASSRAKIIIDNYGNIYNGLSEASRETGCHRVSIQRILKGETKRAFNKDKKEYTFRVYKDDSIRNQKNKEKN